MSDKPRVKKPTEFAIMNELYKKYSSDTIYSAVIGGIICGAFGLILKKPHIGVGIGLGFPIGLTYSKYDRLFAEARNSKKLPVFKEFYGARYYMDKLKSSMTKMKDKIKANPKSDKNAQ